MASQIPGVKHIIAVSSAKGGVGKSTVSMNLAVALSLSGLKVGLMDADVYGPSIPKMLGAEEPPVSHDGEMVDPASAHGVKAMSMGFLVEDDTPMVWRGPMVLSALKQMLFQTNWAPLDVLVLDMPPGTGDSQLSIAQQVSLSGAVVVSTPQDIALLDARKGVNMFKKVNVPIIGFVENMSMFICPHCNGESHIFDHGGARQAADDMDVPFLTEIPLDINLRKFSDEGKPVVIQAPDSKEAACFRELAEKVSGFLTAQEELESQPIKIVIE